MAIIEERLYTVSDVVQWSAWTEQTVRSLVARKKIPHIKLGPQSVRFRECDLQSLIREVPATGRKPK